MKNILNIIMLGFMFCGAVFIGDIGREYLVGETSEPIEIEQVKQDTLSLENGQELMIELTQEGKKIIYISLENLKYVSNKKSRMKKTVEKIHTLFKRLED